MFKHKCFQVFLLVQNCANLTFNYSLPIFKSNDDGLFLPSSDEVHCAAESHCYDNFSAWG